MYIPSHAALGNHPKLRRLARTLAVSRPAAVGHLHYLWWWSQEYAPDGDLSYARYTAEDIADAAMWEGDAYAFVDALRTSGFVDDIDGRLMLHDWDIYGGKVVRDHAKDRERKRAKGNPATSDAVPESSEHPPRNSTGIPVEFQQNSGVDKIRREKTTQEEKRENTAQARAADAPPVALSERQLLHREMFGALCDAFGQPAPGQEKTRYEAAAKALVAAGAAPGEIAHLHEAWGWINPGPPRVNSLAGQLTVLRKATPDQRENGRASPNGNGRTAPVTFAQQTAMNNEAASEEFLAIAEGMTRGSSAVQRPNGSPRRGLSG